MNLQTFVEKTGMRFEEFVGLLNPDEKISKNLDFAEWDLGLKPGLLRKGIEDFIDLTANEAKNLLGIE